MQLERNAALRDKSAECLTVEGVRGHDQRERDDATIDSLDRRRRLDLQLDRWWLWWRCICGCVRLLLLLLG